MKKCLILIIAAALVGFFAMPKDTSAVMMIFKGDYHTVGTIADNVHDLDDDNNDEVDYVETRFRLMSIAASSGVKGILQVEVGWDEWGKSYSYQEGQGAIGATLDPDWGNMSTSSDTGFMADNAHANVAVRWAFVDFTVPDTNLSIQIGKQPIYGYDQIFMTAAGPAPGIQAKYKCGNDGNIKAFWAKLTEGESAFNDDMVGSGDSDQDLYYAEYYQKQEKMGYGGYLGYSRDKRDLYARSGLWSTYQAILTGAGVFPATAGIADGSLNGDAKPWHIDIYYLGGMVDLDVGPVKINGHFVYSMGDMEAVEDGFDDLDINGYFARVKASLPLEWGTVRLQTLYAPGDDDLTDDDMDIFGFTEAPSRLPALNLMTDGPNLLWWGSSTTSSEEYTTFPGPPSGVDFLGKWYTGLSADVPINKKLRFFGEIWYLMVNETDDKIPRLRDNVTAATVTTIEDKDQGIEIDLELHYALTKTLTISGEFDYLIAGDYYDLSHVGGEEPDNAWLAGWSVRYQF